MPSHVNTQTTSQAALEKMLAEQLRRLLGRISWLSGVQVETNPAPFDRAFDLLAHFQVPRGSRIELWVECRLEPRPSQFPYVAIRREFEARTTKRVRVPVFAAPNIRPAWPRFAKPTAGVGSTWRGIAGSPCRTSFTWSAGETHLCGSARGRLPI